MTKFNTHCKDSFKGTLYTLPQSLQWKDLSNCEGIELSTQDGVRVDKDIFLLNNAVRMLQMKRERKKRLRW